MRLGLLGGSFNPIHHGHLAIARHVQERLRLSQVLFIPTGDPPHKRDGALASANVRLEMVRLAIADDPLFTVSDIEMQRKGKSYSIDTIRAVRQQYGPSTELFFIIGLDAFLDFPTWREPQELLRICRFVVVPRPGQSFRALAEMSLLPPLDPESLTELDTGALNRLDIAVPSASGVTCLAVPPCSTSASEIRRRVRNGLPLVNMLPPLVESYILRHSLYLEDSDHTRI
ncbi:nicotinate-nucleotide adenylyltransferase [Candidatus Nitrospira nitrificans]|uniref:Probable nicotinate-nucleotide adenylyltransferase n=1 Tax=Candidatus Nitrospira nitrificans TaxID=1742973 RepID=A0A0S4L7N1_9BACT|nr:nicotinate-nucleotide adenylyltransferase [Candidatus Nitrospira nitrificans]CUS33215.1 putative nicotinate-nucleotide adenylyltransferase [Candidatus Nitrospira nitrificans]